ncbi:MAG: hypothetical protein AB7K68_11145 [Bacteriovoracia bacterium]
MKTLSLLALSVVLGTSSLSAHADLKANFTKMNKTYKGPFGLNVIQGPRGRASIKYGGNSGKQQFQAAYRNDLARAMAAQDNFWTGNLFTTNYYELMGEYVYGNADSSHDLDHARLVAAAPKAIAKASSMVRHWVIEKHYVSQYPLSEIGKGFTLRGISDVVNEQEYANYFFNFYLTAINDDYQYLPAFILVNKSPIVESASIAKARDLVASIYDSYAGTGSDQDSPSPGGQNGGGGWFWGGRGPFNNIISDSGLKEMYKIRNAIHNQLSKEVIGQIDQFLKAYPQYRSDFAPIRQILVEYYGINAGKIVTQAKKLGMSDMAAAAAKVLSKATYIDGLLELSAVAANWRHNLATQIPYEKRAQALALLADTSKILNKELSGLAAASIKDPKVLEAIVNTVYLEGFLIKDNWVYFQAEMRTAGDPVSLFTDIMDASTATLSEAFRPAFTQWVEMEPKMQNFMDYTIKGSALNTVSVAIEKLNKK